MLAAYGLRAGELTHLLVEDVDLTAGEFVIRSKPWLFWFVKTGREWRLPLVPATRAIFEDAIGTRLSGFVFVNRSSGHGRRAAGPALRTEVERRVGELLVTDPDAGEREQKRAATAVAREYGQIPEKRLRCELMAITERIGCPEFTRVHDLRHLFTTRAQAAGVNPLLVQDIGAPASAPPHRLLERRPQVAVLPPGRAVRLRPVPPRRRQPVVAEGRIGWIRNIPAVAAEE